jgi:hypothetical protein
MVNTARPIKTSDSMPVGSVLLTVRNIKYNIPIHAIAEKGIAFFRRKSQSCRDELNLKCNLILSRDNTECQIPK